MDYYVILSDAGSHSSFSAQMVCLIRYTFDCVSSSRMPFFSGPLYSVLYASLCAGTQDQMSSWIDEQISQGIGQTEPAQQKAVYVNGDWNLDRKPSLKQQANSTCKLHHFVRHRSEVKIEVERPYSWPLVVQKWRAAC